MGKILGEKMNEIVTLIKFLVDGSVPYSVYTDEECIDPKSVKMGAVISISIRDRVHLNFDTKGQLIGSSTDDRNSYKARV